MTYLRGKKIERADLFGVLSSIHGNGFSCFEACDGAGNHDRHWRTTDHPSQSGQTVYKWRWAWTGVIPKSETPDPTSPTMFSL